MSDSPWKESARKHKTFVQGGAEASAKPVGNKRKNRKKWCRGKEGVEHQPVCTDYNTVKRHCTPDGWKGGELGKGWRLLVCSVCGRELDYYYPMEWNILSKDGTLTHREPDPPPAWVTF